MEFTYSDEQLMLRDGARRFLEEQSPIERVREVMDSEPGYDAELWKRMAEQGWQAMHLPEEHGGAGFSFAETSILLHEMGRVLAPVPYLSSAVVAAEAIRQSGDPDQVGRWLPQIAAGEMIATLAVVEPAGGWDRGSTQLRAASTDSGHVLTGAKSFVTDAPFADLFVVTALDGDDVGLFVVRAGDVSVERVVSLDMTRPLGTVEMDGAPAERLAQGSWEVVDRVYDVARVAIASEQVGGLERVLEMAVGYAKDRKQFGRAIGSFQAIKHMCADMLVRLESARSAATHAVWGLVNDGAEAALAAPLAKAYCSEAYFKAAGDNIQLHGGIGFTWEHDAHLYFKRAKSTGLLFGSPAEQRALLADRIGL